jgi:hypothetical protein
LTTAGVKVRGISSAATRESGRIKRRDSIRRYFLIFIFEPTIAHSIKRYDKNKAVQMPAQPNSHVTTERGYQLPETEIVIVEV